METSPITGHCEERSDVAIPSVKRTAKPSPGGRWHGGAVTDEGKNCSFLVPNKKGTKKVGLRGTECRAPGREAQKALLIP